MAPSNRRLELKFLGTMNGNSQSHTNAFFMIDEETLVFVDMSLLNMHKAIALIEAYRDTLKSVVLCLTHTHADHVSGASTLAHAVEYLLNGTKLEVIGPRNVLVAARQILCAEGARDGLVDYYALNGARLGDWQKPIPPKYDWLFTAIPTTHDERLMGAAGYMLRLNGKVVIYTGDTNTLEPFAKQVRAATDEYADRPIELYVEAQVEKRSTHLCITELIAPLTQLLCETKELKVILMHYDNRDMMVQECAAFPEDVRQRIYIAEETF